MFNPTRDQVRSFFIESWRKQRAAEPLTAMESMAVDIIGLHPEYHAVLEDPEAIQREFSPDDGQINPFLHLSLHLAIEEQLSIDQPPGIRAATATLQLARGNRHDALHEVLECLGETMFNAQRNNTQPDGTAYLACIRRRGGS
ncbi:DUF1841 family protein [Pseudothauera nasutitermitis]|uniref:DUF1841 family protein n=1 Tax=Pseudothauera nasutitermitis TaxID=2565930 RepID=A0A4S4B7G9_9RHOO|nr:DUF1841 family protein [Pseudothauera nasutitermitis]THF66953.1 DUF1841 family protein [Pseudothauera nasutitermitis]